MSPKQSEIYSYAELRWKARLREDKWETRELVHGWKARYPSRVKAAKKETSWRKDGRLRDRVGSLKGRWAPNDQRYLLPRGATCTLPDSEKIPIDLERGSGTARLINQRLRGLRQATGGKRNQEIDKSRDPSDLSSAPPTTTLNGSAGTTEKSTQDRDVLELPPLTGPNQKLTGEATSLHKGGIAKKGFKGPLGGKGTALAFLKSRRRTNKSRKRETGKARLSSGTRFRVKSGVNYQRYSAGTRK